jgi:tetratricopeptide (TPR) repeat protein
MEAPPADSEMQQAGRAGILALSLEHPDQAADQFKTALSRAQLRDDIAAISDYGYDLAVAELALNRPKAALATARTVIAELRRYGSHVSPSLILVEATALYRTDALPEANALAASIEGPSSDPHVKFQACFLRGLIADKWSDTNGIEATRQCMARPSNTAERADVEELSALISSRRGDPARAEKEAESAADLRRQVHDYHGMARALALGGKAAQQAGSTATASSLYLQAGRSAAAQGDSQMARQWLRRALSLAQDSELRAEVQHELASLRQ